MEISNIFTYSQKDKITTLAIGCFDGMHLAHMQLISYLEKNGALLIIDKKKNDFLCSNDDKKVYSNKDIIIIDFDLIRNLDGISFLNIIKNEFINLKKIIVGYDFTFGKNRQYNAFDIEKLTNIKTIIVDEFKVNNISLHSSKIKEFLYTGNINSANLFLNRKYNIKTKLIKGQGLGKKELVPTLNLQNQDYFLPKNGVYASYNKIQDKLYKSISFIGVRSTDGNFSIESHILDKFDLKLNLGENVELIFEYFIRENIKFDNLEGLKEQIQKDILIAKEIL